MYAYFCINIYHLRSLAERLHISTGRVSDIRSVGRGFDHKAVFSGNVLFETMPSLLQAKELVTFLQRTSYLSHKIIPPNIILHTLTYFIMLDKQLVELWKNVALYHNGNTINGTLNKNSHLFHNMFQQIW